MSNDNTNEIKKLFNKWSTIKFPGMYKIKMMIKMKKKFPAMVKADLDLKRTQLLRIH